MLRAKAVFFEITITQRKPIFEIPVLDGEGTLMMFANTFGEGYGILSVEEYGEYLDHPLKDATIGEALRELDHRERSLKFGSHEGTFRRQLEDVIKSVRRYLHLAVRFRDHGATCTEEM